MPPFTPALSIVTGASSGLGAAFARLLAARGSELVLVARRRERLEALAAELEAAHGIRCTVVPLDLSLPGAGTALRKQLGDRLPDLVVDNAGFGVQGAVAGTDAGRLSQEVAVDVAAVVDICRAFVAPMIERGSGTILNVASTAAYQPVPGMAVYAASKAFVKLFTEALWYEARPHGVRVCAVAPGAIDSEFFEGGERIPAPTGYWAPERVAAAALRMLDRRSVPPEFIIGVRNRLAAFSTRFVPRRLTLFFSARLSGLNRSA